VNVIYCEQGTIDWKRARIGIPTASNFDLILTAKGLKPSASQGKYLNRLCAEHYTGEPIDEGTNGYMQRGTGMEDEAARWYAWEHNAKLLKWGFCVTDDGRAGCSVDRVVGDDGLLEIKCPGIVTHIGYLLGGMDEYGLQVQGQLWITGRKWVDLLSFHPTLPKVVNRIERNEGMIDAIALEVGRFAALVEDGKRKLSDMRPGEVAFTDDEKTPF